MSIGFNGGVGDASCLGVFVVVSVSAKWGSGGGSKRVMAPAMIVEDSGHQLAAAESLIALWMKPHYM